MAIIFSPSTEVFLSIFILFLCFPAKVCSLSSFTQLQLPPNVTGPVSLAFDLTVGGPYAGVNDGRIIRYGGTDVGFTDFAFCTPTRSKAVCDGTTDPDSGPTCGRPLGLSFNNLRNQMYIADAYSGLFVAGTNGRLATKLATSAEGVPFCFLNGLDVDPLSGLVYFTDFSTTIQLRNISRALASGNTTQFSSDATGRLLRYDPETKNVTVLLRGLSGAAGTAVSNDGMFVLVSEFNANRILKFWLRGPKASTAETFVSFRGRPVNIKRTASGNFWVAVNVPNNQSPPTTILTGQRISYYGTILETVSFDDQYGGSTLITEVQQHLGALYIGANSANFVGIHMA
uniref:Strictosidine synthase conserved region domain-containing protein n=1 Tax=Vitis vinifera TaxID=29760 RepID=A5BBM4_VITVI|nr:hypothetical protein VITISV_013355 [Vitis vinifera]